MCHTDISHIIDETLLEKYQYQRNNAGYCFQQQFARESKDRPPLNNYIHWVSWMRINVGFDVYETPNELYLFPSYILDKCHYFDLTTILNEIQQYPFSEYDILFLILIYKLSKKENKDAELLLMRLEEIEKIGNEISILFPVESIGHRQGRIIHNKSVIKMWLIYNKYQYELENLIEDKIIIDKVKDCLNWYNQYNKEFYNANVEIYQFPEDYSLKNLNGDYRHPFESGMIGGPPLSYYCYSYRRTIVLYNEIMKNPALVYILSEEKINPLYKIGVTKNVKRRINQLKTEYAYPVKVIMSFLCKEEDRFIIEKYLHQAFAEKRMNGEWFNLTNDDIEYLNEFKPYLRGSLLYEIRENS